MTFDIYPEYALALCFLCLQTRARNKCEGFGSGDGRPLSSFLWCWRGQTAAGTFYSSVIIYFTKDVWEQKNMTFSKGHLTTKETQIYLNRNFLHGFLYSRTQKSEKCLTWNCTWTSSSSSSVVCEFCPPWPCSIAGLAVAVFIAPPVCTVQYSLLTWCLQQNVQAMMVDGWWRLKPAERRVKSQNALLLSVPVSNQLNKVFLSVSGESQCFINGCFFEVLYDFLFSKDKIQFYSAPSVILFLVL